MAKGSSFERVICKQLSLWWSYNKSDDVFWRTAGSGARATQRSKVNKKTFGQYGDLQATDPRGQKLIDVCHIELKRGYSKYNFQGLIDRQKTKVAMPVEQYEKFIIQTERDWADSPSWDWMLIVKRDRRETLVLITYSFYKLLKQHGATIGKKPPFFFLFWHVGYNINKKIVGTTLENFLIHVKPLHIKKIHKDYKQ